MPLRLQFGPMVVSDCDSNNFVLSEVVTNKKTGEQREVTRGYFTTLESALNKLVTERLRGSDAQDVQTLLTHIGQYRMEMVQTVMGMM